MTFPRRYPIWKGMIKCPFRRSECLARFGVDGRIQEFTESSATVELAAAVVGVIPARIAKTLLV